MVDNEDKIPSETEVNEGSNEFWEFEKLLASYYNDEITLLELNSRMEEIPFPESGRSRSMLRWFSLKR